MSKFIIANWKMNGDMRYAKTIVDIMCQVEPQSLNIVICPPYTLLHFMNKYADDLKHKNKFSLGAQDCHARSIGAFTSHISTNMIKESGAKYVIIGHCERRKYDNETDINLSEKIASCWSTDLIPIVCIGESKKIDNVKDFEKCISESLHCIFDPIKMHYAERNFNNMPKLILSYEPFWAIGSGDTPHVDQIIQCNQLVKRIMSDILAIDKIDIPFVYGGSVDSNNIESIIASVDGVMIGSKSLDLEDFTKIIARSKLVCG